MLPFRKVKKYQFLKNYSYYFINKLYKVKDCQKNSVVVDKN